MKKSGKTQHKLKTIIYSNSDHRDEYSVNSQGKLTAPLARNRNSRPPRVSPANSSSDSLCWPPSPTDSLELGFTPPGAGYSDFDVDWIDGSSNDPFSPLPSFEDFGPLFFFFWS
jgi:hypothetical protein